MNPLARIIDANANRAREALRVLEDAARFAANDSRVSGALKNLRHDLQAAMASLPVDRGALLASRDTEGDVDVPIKTAPELERGGLHDAVAAAASRLTEALRSLEESSKALGAASAAATFESIRYRAYTADKELSLTLGSPRRRQWRLCVLVTEALCTHHSWLEVSRLAIEGGADCVQLREKTLSDRELLQRARSLVELAHSGGAAVIINDRVDIALLSGADGVHLGQTDMPIAAVRELAGTRVLVGVSTENLDQAHAAATAGADYIALGPMFPTTTKEKPRLAGPSYVRQYFADERLASIPHLAIGGINGGNLAELAANGCRGVAVSSYVCSANDPGSSSRDLISRLSMEAAR